MLEPTLFAFPDEPDDAVVDRMIRELDVVLKHPPRTQYQPHTLLFHADDPIDGVYVLESGQVKLYKTIDGEEVVFHGQTAGRIIGLLALARRSRTFFNCETVTPVTLLHVRSRDLEQAIQQSEILRAAFITVLMRSMARRSTRLVEVQTEALTLNHRLFRERDALAHALQELQQAQSLLIESEKLATLGQLAAGVAHELNNPVAAINRAADYIREDLQALAKELPAREAFESMLERVWSQKPLSTREQRTLRHQLEQELNPPELANDFVRMGIHSVSEWKQLAGSLPGGTEARVAQLNRYYQMGSAVRNIASCAERISGLVKSLRSYSRSDEADVEEVDLHEGIEDTLRLFGNRLRDVEVDRQYSTLPLIRLNPGSLNQVWTNLIANALDAMQDRGRLTIMTCALPDHVEVRVIDSGPGIPPANLKRIFDLRFTTRQGRVEFGLGLGLAIAQNIITRHDGHIDVQSEPGRTEFCVCLPRQPTVKVTPQQGANHGYE